MKDLRYLALFVLMALLVACDVTRAAAPLVLPQSTAAPQAAHVPPAEVVVKPRRIPNGLKVEGTIPEAVTERFYHLAALYPDVAQQTRRIVARRAGRKGWVISYERTVIYINVDRADVTDVLTEQYGRRVYVLLKRTEPQAVKRFKTWQQFSANLLIQVGAK